MAPLYVMQRVRSVGYRHSETFVAFVLYVVAPALHSSSIASSFSLRVSVLRPQPSKRAAS